MLSGELTGLRARTSDDAEILHRELYEDVEGWVRASNRPWVPIPPGPGSPYAADDPAEERRGPAPDAADPQRQPRDDRGRGEGGIHP